MKTLFLISLALALPAAAQLALIRQGRESAGTPETGDQFGFAVCAGDFNNDGYDDLATGAPYEHISGITSVQSGFVTINRGSRYGLTWLNAMGMSPGGSALSDAESHQMGHALASADFNNDGYDDLAVGLPASAAGGVSNAGRVLIYHGSAAGLSATANQVLTQTNFGGANEAGDRFGATLAAGKLGTDSFADLVIGGPGEDAGAGAIFIIRGGAAGLNVAQAFFVRPVDIGTTGGAFGSALAIGNVIGQSHAEVLVGAPDTDAGIIQNAGAVHLLIGGTNTISTANAQHFDAAADGGFYQTNGRFGASLAVGDFFDNGGERDVAVGAPGRNNGRGTVSFASGGLLALQWGNVLTCNSPQDDAAWGATLAVGDFNGNGSDTLAIGSPFFDYPDQVLPGDAVNSGRVDFFSPQAGGPQGGGNVIQEKKASAGFSANAQLGSSVAFGRFSQGPRAGIAVGCPGRDTARGQVLDYSPGRQVDSVQCTSALAVDCDDRINYALRPFDRVSIASTTKIMTVLLACEATQRPASDPLHVGLDEEYTIEPWMQVAYPPTTGCSVFLYHSPAFDRYTLRELMHSAMIRSGNDSCYAIADAMTGEINAWSGNPCPGFLALMNARAAQIGMNDSHFDGAAGVDEPDHYSTAYDMWLLGRTAMQNALFREMANTVDYDVPKLVPGAEAGIFEGAVSHLSWSWMKGLKSREPRIVGCKPGSTGGAKHTGVVAARQSVAPHGLAFATGFGFETTSLGQDKLAALVQLALEECDPDYSPADNLVAGPPVEGEWIVNDSQRSEMSHIEFARPGDAPDEETTLVLYPLAPVVPGQPKKVQWDYNIMWELKPGQTATCNVVFIGGARFAVSDVSEHGGTGFYRSLDGGREWTFQLPAGGVFSPPAWSSRTAEPYSFSLTNNGATTRVCVVNVAMEVHPDFLWWPTAHPNYRVELRNDTASIRTQHHVREAPLSTSSSAPFPMLVALEDRGRGERVRPAVNIQHFAVTPGAGGRDGVVLLFSTLPGGIFHESFDIKASSDLKPGSWQSVGRIPANSTGSYTWTGSLEGQFKFFFHVEALP